MTMQCNICSADLNELIYESSLSQGLTSLCELRPGRVKIWLCPSCSHLHGDVLIDTKDYYQTDYRISLHHEDEDQIYDIHGKDIIYRTDHQINTLLANLTLPKNSRILDYGCAKASTLRKVLFSRPDLRLHLFDVSPMYVEYWRKFVPEEQWAIYDTPAGWAGYFDVVTSFFALEHIPEPIKTVKKIAGLLANDGIFYGIVPNTFDNIADFVVIDHINHFTEHSLHYLLKKGGFVDIRINTEIHRGAFVFTARKVGVSSHICSAPRCSEAGRQLARYWAELQNHIISAELFYENELAAIYGSGFYGAYIFSLLSRPELVKYFLDMSPYQQKKILFGRKILSPKDLPEDIKVLYIALNPLIAKSVVDSMDWIRGRDIKLIFLKEDIGC